MTIGGIFRSGGSDLSAAVQRATSGIKPVFGTIIGGVAVSVLGSGERAIDKLKKKAQAQIENSRSQIDPKTRVGVIGLFGGRPLATVFVVAGVAVLAVVLLRRR